MPVKRRQSKKRTHVITPEVVDAFAKMEAARELGDSDAWWESHHVVHSGLNLFPHEWPAFEDPRDECPYPAGCHAAEHWRKTRESRPEAFELFHELMAALKAHERQPVAEED